MAISLFGTIKPLKEVENLMNTLSDTFWGEKRVLTTLNGLKIDAPETLIPEVRHLITLAKRGRLPLKFKIA